MSSLSLTDREKDNKTPGEEMHPRRKESTMNYTKQTANTNVKLYAQLQLKRPSKKNPYPT